MPIASRNMPKSNASHVHNRAPPVHMQARNLLKPTAIGRRLSKGEDFYGFALDGDNEVEHTGEGFDGFN